MQKLHDLYGGQATGASSAMPNGKFRNRLFAGDNAGTPLEMGWANNVWGALSGILKMAGITANNNEENADTSQVALGVKSIAHEAIRKSFKYGNSANPGNQIECHALLRTLRVSDEFYLDFATGVITQAEQTSAGNSVDLPIPYGRFTISSFGAYVTNHTSGGAQPLALYLRRRNIVSNSIETISTIQYNTGSNARGNTLLPYHSIENGWIYYVSMRGQNESGAPNLQIRDIYIVLEQLPVTL